MACKTCKDTGEIYNPLVPKLLRTEEDKIACPDCYRAKKPNVQKENPIEKRKHDGIDNEMNNFFKTKI